MIPAAEAFEGAVLMKSRALGAILLAVFSLAQAPASVRLYVFDCGKLDIPDITPYQMTRAQVATNVMSVPCFLIAHPRGTLMWDVGVVPDRLIPPGGTGTLRGMGTSTKRLETQRA
jgi:hypothetical protein